MKFRLDKSVGFWSLVATFALVLAAMILSILSNSSGAAEGGVYGVGNIGMVIAFCAICMVLELAALAISCLFDNALCSIVADVLRLVAAGLMIACFAVMVNTRGDLMGYIWFSELERDNPHACAALNYALASWIIYFLAIVGCAVSLLSDFCKKPDEEKIEKAK